MKEKQLLGRRAGWGTAASTADVPARFSPFPSHVTQLLPKLLLPDRTAETFLFFRGLGLPARKRRLLEAVGDRRGLRIEARDFSGLVVNDYRLLFIPVRELQLQEKEPRISWSFAPEHEQGACGLTAFAPWLGQGNQTSREKLLFAVLKS